MLKHRYSILVCDKSYDSCLNLSFTHAKFMYYDNLCCLNSANFRLFVSKMRIDISHILIKLGKLYITVLHILIHGWLCSLYLRKDYEILTSLPMISTPNIRRSQCIEIYPQFAQTVWVFDAFSLFQTGSFSQCIFWKVSLFDFTLQSLIVTSVYQNAEMCHQNI